MPLGKTETMSSMAGPNSITYYDNRYTNLLKRLMDQSHVQLNQVDMNPNLSDAEKLEAVEKIKDEGTMMREQLKRYSEDPKFRELQRKTAANITPNLVTPEWDKAEETVTRTNPSRILDLEKPNVMSKASTASESGITSVGWGEEPTKQKRAPRNRKEFLARQQDPTGASVRTRNFLDNNVQSMEDFMNITEAKVRQTRNVGKKSWEEIKAIQDKIKKDPKSWGFYRKELEIPELEYSSPRKSTPPPVPGRVGRSSGIAKGLGKAVVRGLAEAPALEFLNPPSAGPSDPDDPVYQYERGLISQAEFNRRMGI